MHPDRARLAHRDCRFAAIDRQEISGIRIKINCWRARRLVFGKTASQQKEGKLRYDTLIVGGGIVGTAAAFFLSRKGQKIALLEKTDIGAGTTASNFSWVNGTSKTSNAAYHHLNAQGIARYDELAAEFGADKLGLLQTGSLGLAKRADRSAHANLREQAGKLSALGYENRWLAADELQSLEPDLAIARDTEGLLCEQDKCLNAPHFTRFMAARIRAAGGEVFTNCAATSLIADDSGRVSGIESEKGEMHAPNVLIATGPDTPEILASLTGFDGFARFPVGKVPGLLVTTPATAQPMARHLVYTDMGGEFHFMPDFNGGLRLGSDITDGRIIDDQSPENLNALAQELLHRLRNFIPDFPAEYMASGCSISIGTRAYPEDGHSIAGAFPGADGLFVVATHSGITLAPVLGDLMANLIADGEVATALAPFGPDRLSGFG